MRNRRAVAFSKEREARRLKGFPEKGRGIPPRAARRTELQAEPFSRVKGQRGAQNIAREDRWYSGASALCNGIGRFLFKKAAFAKRS